MEITHFIHEALDELFADGPLADCFVVEIVQGGRRGVTVFFDSDSGVSLDKCRQVSRFLESRLDEQQFHNGEYVLDVSSPGVDRPLTQWRQYPRHKGRKLLVVLKEEGQIEGKLTDVGLESIMLEVNTSEIVDIPFEDISESFVQISF
jgi:ribosome maturation factor RimP